MMSMNSWMEDFSLAADWGQDLELPGFPYDDAKVVSYKSDVGLQDNFSEQSLATELSSQNTQYNGLGIDWMDSTDLSSLLEELDQKQFEMGHPLNLEPVVGQDVSCSQISDEIIVDFPGVSFSEEKEVEFQHQTLVPVRQDVLLTPPESPEQVAPEIPLGLNANSNLVADLRDESSVFDSCVGIKEEIILDQGLVFDFQLEPAVCIPEVQGDHHEDALYSPISLEPPSPESSTSSNASQLIQASPELYKVIKTSPTVTLRFSPYQTKSNSTGTRKAKGSKGKPLVEPEVTQDEVVSSHVNKKDRKKMQNKNAAIRYREKKRKEATVMKSEEDELEDRNNSLKTNVEDLQREIKYMKDLIEDVCKAKGLIPTFNAEVH